MSAPKPDLASKTVDQVREALEASAGMSRHAYASERPAVSRLRAPPFDFRTLSEYEVLKVTRAVGSLTEIDDPYYRLHDGRAADTTSIAGRTVVNFCSYDYLGLNGHPRVIEAAKAAIDRYGTTVSASRLSAGERQVHRDLEKALARLLGTEDALAFVSGHAANVSVIGELLGPEDLIVGDLAIHNSLMLGAKLSGARRIMCPHGDIVAIERALRLNRARHRRALVVVEGLYGMDGDVPDLVTLVKLKQRYNAWLMVDEAHATGVLGRSGRGLAEEKHVDPGDVEIWMGTLSKALASTGGYIAGSRALIDIVKHTAPGFVYSVGMAPPVAAAATAAIDVLEQEPWRVEALRRNGLKLLNGARERGLDTGLSIGASVVPILIGNSLQTVVVAHRLFARGYNVAPAIFPGVAENQARLRLFVTARHMAEQFDRTLDAIAEELCKARNGPSFVQAFSGR